MGPNDEERQEAHNEGEQDERDHEGASWIDHAMYSDYTPPSDPDLKEAYDAGWDNAEDQ